jgi:TolA-binding protein
MHPIRTALIVTLALAGTAPLGGCFWVTTKHEGKELRKDVTELEKKVDEGLGSKVERLEKVLAEATRLLTRNSADIGSEVSSLGEEQRRLNGLVLEAKRLADQIGGLVERHEVKLAEVEQRLAALESKTAQPAAKTAPELWSEGQAAMSAGNYGRAEILFRELVVKFPSDDKADDAQFQRGEAHARARAFDKALPEFQKVYEKYPTSTWADQALYRAGEMAEALKWCTDARAYYGLLRQKYPKSSLFKKAQARDAVLKKSAKDKKVCQS